MISIWTIALEGGTGGARRPRECARGPCARPPPLRGGRLPVGERITENVASLSGKRSSLVAVLSGRIDTNAGDDELSLDRERETTTRWPSERVSGSGKYPPPLGSRSEERA